MFNNSSMHTDDGNICMACIACPAQQESLHNAKLRFQLILRHIHNPVHMPKCCVTIFRNFNTFVKATTYDMMGTEDVNEFLHIKQSFRLPSHICSSEHYLHFLTIEKIGYLCAAVKRSATFESTDSSKLSSTHERLLDVGEDAKLIVHHGAVKRAQEGNCSKCGAHEKSQKFKLCARCKITKYCSETCQKSHWNDSHKFFCSRQKPQKRPFNRNVQQLWNCIRPFTTVWKMRKKQILFAIMSDRSLEKLFTRKIVLRDCIVGCYIQLSKFLL